MLDVGVYKTPIKNVHKIGWKKNYFTSSDVSMLGSGCGVSSFTQFYDQINKKYQFLPLPYVGIYSGEKVNKFLQETWILAVSKSVETFVML